MSHITSSQGVRFTLKKRSIQHSSENVNISSYNSDFLTGLFADVAKITQLSGSTSSKCGLSKRCGESAHVVAPSPKKKHCTPLTRRLSRAVFSTTNLADLNDRHTSTAINSGVCHPEKRKALHVECHTACKSPGELAQHDSLAFQLDCVAGERKSFPPADVAAIIAFPNLPATVSDSSCSAGLTRVNLIKQASSHEKQTKESFGWFVDLDDHQSVEVKAGLPYSVSNDELAFQAPTAPLRIHNDAEVLWAKAADTVDDVLGDFF